MHYEKSTKTKSILLHATSGLPTHWRIQGEAFRAMALPKGIKWPMGRAIVHLFQIWPPNYLISIKNKHKIKNMNMKIR